MILHSKIYCTEEITTMLWNYALNSFEGKPDELMVNDDGVTPIEKFVGITTHTTLKHHHTWSCPVYVLDERLQVNIYGLPKW